MKHSIFRRKNLHRSFFHRNPRPAQFRGIRSEVPIVKISHAGVVLHDQRSAGRNKIQQLLIIRRLHLSACRKRESPARSFRTAPRSSLASFSAGISVTSIPSCLQHCRNIISRAHDVANLQIMRHLHIDHAYALHCRLVVIKAAQIFARHQRVTFAEFLAVARFEHRPNLCSTFLQSGREDLELEILSSLRVSRTPPQAAPAPTAIPSGNSSRSTPCASRLRLLVTPTVTVVLAPLCVEITCVPGSSATENAGTTASGRALAFPASSTNSVTTVAPMLYLSLRRTARRNRIFRARPQHRRREGKRRIFLVVDVIQALRLRIVTMPVWPRILRISSAPSDETPRAHLRPA